MAYASIYKNGVSLSASIHCKMALSFRAGFSIYSSRKKDKNQNESRIRYLEKMIKTAKIISTDSAEDEVGMNNTVTVYFEEDDEEEVYKLVTTVRGNSLKNLISNESPLGKALLGHRVGDRVEVVVNENYSYYVVIRKIENTVDDGTDKLRSF